MNRRRVTVAAAAAGVVAGVVGMGVLAMPAGAGPAPVLPAIEPQALVESVLTAKPAAFGGSVDVDNDLGLPGLPGVPAQLTDGDSGLRVWSDGTGKFRVQAPSGDSDKTFVDDGSTAWLWNSAEKTVARFPHGPGEKPEVKDGAVDPVTVAREVVTRVEEFSTVSVDGTARVADRAAYELVLTPKPTEKTVLREVRIAVDAELRLPLRIAVYTNGTNEPAARIGFSQLSVGAQDPALFAFTPPAGAKIVNEADGPSEEEKDKAREALDGVQPVVIGDGWDTVVGTRVRFDKLGELQDEATEKHGKPEGLEGNPQDLLKRLGKPVSGAWGNGVLITTKVGSALVADDGRVVAGAVPEQVLFEAIGQVK
ncbi:sigma-E factor regulatory protein RseB domain-containing protein [Saccharothrix violaceirubra]|uniref:Outer membrane lipoprotein-sorting protein n=1 Tax=Saccharothrix violaceirubra TaxID=413306 RepID=A0A7W7T8B2_9PSEU|nr:DUF2092 domain-containing protein [Saccharothrix violaceirubra]MBB4968443.1 outer membrane lipoprotein-sorting protein [Saccharothrix violaceirubra]